jgi:CheY-like chemotaxis protein
MDAMTRKTCRILVVEDDALVAVLLEDLLEEFACEIVGPVARLAAALRLARDEAVDLAILDVNIGGEPSYGVAELLLARGTKLLFVTGYGREQLAERFRDQPVLAKPFSSAQFRAAVTAAFAEGPCPKS